MSTETKYPTPNTAGIISSEFSPKTMNPRLERILLEAVQADIALAVAANRVTVPDDVLETIRDALRGHAVDASNYISDEPQRVKVAAEIKAASKWLESLTVAPKEAPTDKRCGTCAFHRLIGPNWPSGKCALMPSVVTFVCDGADCPCWKAKTCSE